MKAKISKLLTVLFGLLLFANGDIIAQDEGDSRLSDKQLEKLWSARDFSSIKKEYTLRLKEDSSNADAHYNIGVVEIESEGNHAQSKFHLEKVLNLEKQLDYPEFFYYLGRAYHFNHDYFFALAAYNTYFYTLPEGRKNKEVRREMEYLIAKAENGSDLIERDSSVFNRFVTISEHRVLYFTEGLKYVQIDNMESPINSAFSEYGPVIFSKNNMLLFTSRRGNGGGVEEMYFDGQHYEDIYSAKNKRGDWHNIQPVDSLSFFDSKLFNTADHEATVSLSKDESTLLLFKQNAIQLMHKDSNGTWGEMQSVNKVIQQKLPYVNGASISSDGATLVVSATNPTDTENEHLDLYIIKKDSSGKWSGLKNLGSPLNTSYDETSPYVYNDTTLYFSSNSAASIGEYDVFKSVLNNGNWSEPKNLGVPINSAYNEVNYSIGTKSKYAFLASDRPNGYGKYDIYMVTKGVDYDNQYAHLFAQQEKERLAALNDENNTDKDGDLIAGLNNGAEGSEGNSSSNGIDGSEENTSNNGAFDNSAGINGSSTLNGTNGQGKNEKGSSTSGTGASTGGSGVGPMEVLFEARVFFGFDKSTLASEEIKTLNDFAAKMKNQQNLQIFLAGHTDSKGDEDYNQKLSMKRAEYVQSKLIGAGLSNKYRVFGFGENAPYMNETNEQDMAKNRQVMIRVYK